MGKVASLDAAAPFLQLIFQASKLQARALLETVDTKQIRAIREIIHNLLEGGFPLTSTEQTYIERRRKVLTRIIRKRGYKAGDIIGRHHRIVYETLCLVEDYILPLL